MSPGCKAGSQPRPALGTTNWSAKKQHIALLAKAIKSVDELSARCCGELQRLDNAIVMIVPSGSIACDGQGSSCCLKSSVVSDRKPPASRQLLHLASYKVAIRKRQQVRDLFRTCSVLNQPTVLKPSLQAHSRSPIPRVSSLSIRCARNGSRLPVLIEIRTLKKQSG